MKKIVMGLMVVVAMMAAAGEVKTAAKKSGKPAKAAVQKSAKADRIKELEAENKRLKEENGKLEKTISELETQIMKRKALIEELGQENVALRDEKELAQEEVEKLTKENELMREEMKKLAEKNAQLEVVLRRGRGES